MRRMLLKADVDVVFTIEFHARRAKDDFKLSKIVGRPKKGKLTRKNGAGAIVTRREVACVGGRSSPRGSGAMERGCASDEVVMGEMKCGDLIIDACSRAH